MEQAAGHRQVADKHEAAGGCGPSRRHSSCPNGDGVSRKGRDRWRRRSQAQPLPGAVLAEPWCSETYLPAGSVGLVRWEVSSWGDVVASHFSDRPGW